MSKRRPQRRPAESVVARRELPVPAEITRAVAVIQQTRAGELLIELAENGYRKLDEFTIADHRIESGSVSNARSRLHSRQLQQFFAFASYLGSTGSLQTHRLERSTRSLQPITVMMHARQADGFMVHLPKKSLEGSQLPENMLANAAFTTGERLIGPAKPAVSFVVSDPSQRANERTMATATEIAQNRTIVDGVEVGNKMYVDEVATAPFQESLANGVGNMLGAIALRWPYSQYVEYLQTTYSQIPMHANTVPGRFGLRGIELIAPHIAFDVTTYQQIAQGELPTGMPSVHAIVT